MNKTILKFGLFALLTAVGLFMLALLLGKGLDFTVQEVIGYSTMAISLIFVFFGIRQYRDHENEGTISFLKALGVGMLISLFAAIGFGLIDYLFTTVIHPDFAIEYETKMLADMKASLPPVEFEIEKAKLQQQMQDYGGSGFMAAMMFAMVAVMGFIISLISALMLQKK
jgi:hypothetical protein